MSEKKTLTFVLMDPPYENARSTTALRLLDRAIKKGFHVNVFAYEGAVNLPFAHQKGHPNPVHERDAEQEDHPLPREWIEALLTQAKSEGVQLDWVNCGWCVDERGAGDCIDGIRRGGPPDFVKMLEGSDNTLVIPTRS